MSWWGYMLLGGAIVGGVVLSVWAYVSGRRGDAAAQLAAIQQRRAEAALDEVEADHDKAERLLGSARQLRTRAARAYELEGLDAETIADRFRGLDL